MYVSICYSAIYTFAGISRDRAGFQHEHRSFGSRIVQKRVTFITSVADCRPQPTATFNYSDYSINTNRSSPFGKFHIENLYADKLGTRSNFVKLCPFQKRQTKRHEIQITVRLPKHRFWLRPGKPNKVFFTSASTLLLESRESGGSKRIRDPAVGTMSTYLTNHSSRRLSNPAR